MNHNRTTRIHASKFKLGLEVEEGCSYHPVTVSKPQYSQFSHYKINHITLLTLLMCTNLAYSAIDIIGLFKDVFTCCVCTASIELLAGNELKSIFKGHSSELKVLSQHLPGDTEEAGTCRTRSSIR
jgi:hypothetical protein